MLKPLNRVSLVLAVALGLAACQDEGRLGSAKAYQPIPMKTVKLMSEQGMTANDPILIRSYKKESEIEVWKRNSKGEYALLKTFPICRWSGQLGPKVKEGDRQVPEGFYTITPAQMNPNSSFYLSFDTGYPNAFDRANGRTGKYLMVHGACTSSGCFSMTDEQIAEIYAIGREAFAGGQRSFQFQSFPFRMTAQNLAKHRSDPNIAFWRTLKEGSDIFEVTKQEPFVGVCSKRYVFGTDPSVTKLDPTDPCPAVKVDEQVAQTVRHKEQEDAHRIAELVSKGTKAVKLVYDDGGQHPSFRATSYGGEGSSIMAFNSTPVASNVSRPEALASGPREIVLEDRPLPAAVQPTAVAVAKPAKGVPAADPTTQVAQKDTPAADAPEAVTQLAKTEPRVRPADEGVVSSLAPPPARSAAAQPDATSSATAFISKALSLESLLAVKTGERDGRAKAGSEAVSPGEQRSEAPVSLSGSQPVVPGMLNYAPAPRR